MKEHPNFYETVEEVRMRLKDSVILYDGKPYYVLNVANHKKDNVFRLYLDPLSTETMPYQATVGNAPCNWGANDSVNYAIEMDAWMETEAGKKSGIIRKQMTSPLFNKYRPFPLGMCNYGGDAVYVTRMPTRSTIQGLQGSSFRCVGPSLNPVRSDGMPRPNLLGSEICQTILGMYPAPQDCIDSLLDKRCTNSGVAFHREFALLKGPIDLLFLAYKNDVIGVLVENNFSRVRLGSNYTHLREVVEELNLFQDIV